MVYIYIYMFYKIYTADDIKYTFYIKMTPHNNTSGLLQTLARTNPCTDRSGKCHSNPYAHHNNPLQTDITGGH